MQFLNEETNTLHFNENIATAFNCSE